MNTPGPWWMAETVTGYAVGAGDKELAVFASRDDALLAKTAPELVEALRGLLAACPTLVHGAPDVVKDRAHAALAKAGVLEPDNRDPDIRQGRYAQYDNITGKRL